MDRSGLALTFEGGSRISHRTGMNEPCPMPGCRVEAITPDGPDLLHVDARSTRPGGRCPDCGRASRAVHSRYRRRPADLPSHGRRVRVGLRVRRFYCRNAKCARRTFAEHLPELVAPHARRTCRLGEAQGRVGVALGGAAGARLLQRLARPASAGMVGGVPASAPTPSGPAAPRLPRRPTAVLAGMPLMRMCGTATWPEKR